MAEADNNPTRQPLLLQYYQVAAHLSTEIQPVQSQTRLSWDDAADHTTEQKRKEVITRELQDREQMPDVRLRTAWHFFNARSRETASVYAPSAGASKDLENHESQQ